MRASLSCQNGYQKLGYVGKRKLKKILCTPHFFYWLPFSLLFSLLLAGCGKEDLGERLQSGRVLAWEGLQGRWVGPVAPTDPACGPTTHGLMTIGEKGFGFDPFASTVVIQGKLDPAGHLSGTLIREGGNHQQVAISFNAAASDPNTIQGTIQSNRCQWTVTLHRG